MTSGYFGTVRICCGASDYQLTAILASLHAAGRLLQCVCALRRRFVDKCGASPYVVRVRPIAEALWRSWWIVTRSARYCCMCSAWEGRLGSGQLSGVILWFGLALPE